MITLRDTILIAVPPERVWAWLSDPPLNYRSWHPAHVGCQLSGGTRLTATLDMGVRWPVIGPVLDGPMRLLLGSGLRAIQQHTREEGANLKSLLEEEPEPTIRT